MKEDLIIADDILSMSFEKAVAELEGIVNRLESGDVALEESIAIYQRGNQLRAHCENKLKDAQIQIEKITQNGEATEPLDVEE
ncbi:MAG: exodeoxyribonuclease VII small subunit [Parvibaculales bacterium]